MMRPEAPCRREFLQWMAAAGVAALGGGLRAAGRKPLRGIFPIAQTPFTDSGKLDTESLVAEYRFTDRGRVHGFVWPQLASEWSILTESERIEGAEAIAAEARRLGPALVLGVQGPDTAAAVRYAKLAERLEADAIISLPPGNTKDTKAIVEYYQEVGKATSLPLFVQAVGNMSVDTIVEMYKAVPTLRYVKDEAGEPLMRIGPLQEATSGELKVFTGGHGKTLIDEMNRGFSGSMPAASFADLYASVWDLWHEGKHKQAMDLFGRAAMLIYEISVYGIESLKYILYLRGVFKTYGTRSARSEGKAGGATRIRLDDAGKQILREMLDNTKPFLRA